MSDWLDAAIGCLERGETCVLVTVAATEGSAPRPAGAKMLVHADGIAGSVGGGHLEFKAIGQARALPAGTEPCAQLPEFALGPGLGQCCGGRVTLVMERLAQTALPWLRRWRSSAGETLLVTSIAPYAKTIIAPAEAARHALSSAISELESQTEPALLRRRAEDGTCYLLERMLDPRHDLWLFGAGHVGRALIRILALLPYRVRWIDARAEMFPADLPDNVEAEVSDSPDHDVAAAPADSFFLVMTHSHAADLEICDRILGRGDFAYLGLIGSASKRASFRRRLGARGHSEAALSRLICPIGLPQVTGKEPASIAVAVAGELLALAEAIARDGRAAASTTVGQARSRAAR